LAISASRVAATPPTDSRGPGSKIATGATCAGSAAARAAANDASAPLATRAAPAVHGSDSCTTSWPSTRLTTDDLAGSDSSFTPAGITIYFFDSKNVTP